MPSPAADQLHGVPWEALQAKTCRLARQYWREHGQVTDVSDYESAGLEGLAEAYAVFDPARNDDFAGYAARYITGRMVDLTRRTLGRGEGRPHTPVDLGADPDQEKWDRLTAPPQVQTHLRSARRGDRDLDLRGLSGDAYWLAIWYYVEGWREREIGAALGVTESRICQRLRQVRETLAINRLRLAVGPLDFELYDWELPCLML